MLEIGGLYFRKTLKNHPNFRKTIKNDPFFSSNVKKSHISVTLRPFPLSYSSVVNVNITKNREFAVQNVFRILSF